MFLEVPYFATSVYKSSKHVGLSFAYDAPKIWNDLPDDVHLVTPLHSFRKKLKTYLFAQAYPPNFGFSQFLSMTLTFTMLQVNDYSFLLFLFSVLGVFRWK